MKAPETTFKRMQYFLVLEDNQGAHRYLKIENATDDEAMNFLEDAYVYTPYRAIYLYDAYCPECYTFGNLIDCDHEVEPATHCDYVHCRIDVDELKKGVTNHV